MLGWIGFQHYTARPAVDIERRDKEGRAYTDIREVPLKTADPQLHTHVTVLNSILTESGHVGALDLDRLAGRVKELGAVYHAQVATRARRLGIEVMLDARTRAARLAAVPDTAPALFSKRTTEAQQAARDFARRKGIDWAAIAGDQKVALLKAGAAETRQAKTETAEGLEQKSDFAVWREQVAAAAYRHRSILWPDQVVAAPAVDERRAAAYSTALPLLEEELKRRAVLDSQELREIAARALVAAGIGERPGDDIDAVLTAFRDEGVVQEPQRCRQPPLAVPPICRVRRRGRAGPVPLPARHAAPSSHSSAPCRARKRSSPTATPPGGRSAFWNATRRSTRPPNTGVRSAR